jgi:hypothetical protein
MILLKRFLLFFCTLTPLPTHAWEGKTLTDFFQKSQYFLGVSKYSSSWEFSSKNIKTPDAGMTLPTAYEWDYDNSGVYPIIFGIKTPNLPLTLQGEFFRYKASLTLPEYSGYSSVLLYSGSSIISEFYSAFTFTNLSFSLGWEIPLVSHQLISLIPYLKFNSWKIENTSYFIDYTVASSTSEAYSLSQATTKYNLSYGLNLNLRLDDNIFLTLGCEQKSIPNFSLISLDENDSLTSYVNFSSQKNWQTYASIYLNF